MARSLHKITLLVSVDQSLPYDVDLSDVLDEVVADVTTAADSVMYCDVVQVKGEDVDLGKL